MRRFPAGAVLRYDHTWIEFFERLNRRRNDRLESRPGEMESADDCVNLIHSRELSRAFQCIHHAGVAAAGQHDKPPVLDIENDRLIVMNPWVGLPLAVDP